MSTRPGKYPPEFLQWLPAVAEAMRGMPTPKRCTSAGWALAPAILEAVAADTDPRALFDAGKSTRMRDWTAEAVLRQFNDGKTIPDAIRAVAVETGRDEKTVRRHLRAYERELWPGGIKWARNAD